MVSAQPQWLQSLEQPHAVSVNLGNYEGSGLAELALAVVDDNNVTLYLYAIDELSNATAPMELQNTLHIAEAPWWDTAQYKYVPSLLPPPHTTSPPHSSTRGRNCHGHLVDARQITLRTACGWCRAI